METTTDAESAEANNPEVHNPISDEIDEKDRILVLENYLKIKNGVTPVNSMALKRAALNDYNTVYAKAHWANQAIAERSSLSCRRFLQLYNNVGMQLSLYYDQLLSLPNLDRPVAPPDLPPDDLRENIAARIKVLNLFEAALFSMALMGSEAGQSGLDKQARNQCQTAKRDAWLNLLMRVHQRAETLQTSVFGIDSMVSPMRDVYRLQQMNNRYQQLANLKTFAFISGEVVVSLIGWEKVVSPGMRKLLGTLWLTPTGRLARFTASSLYILAWVAIDRELRHSVPFMQSAPVISLKDALSGWEWLVYLGEDFVVSNLISPPLYFAYLQLMAIVQRQQALEFLISNEEVIVSAEKEYGSVEDAIKMIKLQHMKGGITP